MTSGSSLPTPDHSGNRRLPDLRIIRAPGFRSILSAALVKAENDRRRGIFLPYEVETALAAYRALLDVVEVPHAPE